MFIVKPMYFNRKGLETYRLYLVYDTEVQRYERARTGQNILVPNYAFRGKYTVLNELRDHFTAKGYDQKSWRLSAPSFHSYEDLNIYLAGAEIVAS